MTIDLKEAATIVHRILVAEFGQDLSTGDGDNIVVVAEKATDYGEAWLVPFNSQRFLDGGDPIDMILPGGVLVPKDPRYPAHFPPTAFPIPEYLAMLRSGEMSWPD